MEYWVGILSLDSMIVGSIPVNIGHFLHPRDTFIPFLTHVCIPRQHHNNIVPVKLTQHLYACKYSNCGRRMLKSSLTRHVIHNLKSLIFNTGWPTKNGTVDTVDFQDFALINSYLFSPCWIEYFFLIIITPRSSNFGWELFILWVLAHGLSFSGFARFPEFRGTINDKLMANPENDSPWEITH